MAFTKLEPKSVNTSATFTFADANITGNLSVNGNTDLGDIGKVTITGGVSGQVIGTDGTGNLTWVDGGVGTAVVSPGFTGFSVDTFTGDGGSLNFTLTETPDSRDYVVVNIDGVMQQQTAFNLIDNTLIFTEPPAEGEVIEVIVFLARGLTTAGSNTQVQYNKNGDLAGSTKLTFNDTTGVLQASFLKGDGYQIGNIRAANIYGEVPSSHMSGTVFANAQPNITSVGTLTSLTVSGNVTASKFIGDGSLLTGVTAGVAAPAGANTQVQFNDDGITAGNSAFTFNKTTGTVTATKFSGDGSLLTGVVTDLTGYATQTYVNTQISNLVDSAPTALNTLNELAAALGDDANFSTTVTNTLANKLNANAFTYANITGKPTLSTVATSGSYTDLINKPSIPTDVSDLTDTTNLLGGGGGGGVTSYNDLTDKPFIPTDVSDLTDTTSLLGGVYVKSAVTSLVTGSELTFNVDMANLQYPRGVFTLTQLGPVTITTTDVWSSGTATKNAYINYETNSVNTRNIQLTVSLANATFAVNAVDTITIGSSVITGSDVTSLGISGTGGTYTIPSSLFSSSLQTSSPVTVSMNLTTSRGAFASTGTTLNNTPPTRFNVTSLTGSFGSSSIPFWSKNQTFTWSASVTGTASTGNVTYANAAQSISGSLTSSGATSGTSVSLDSTLTYTISSSDYYGAGLNGAGSRTIPATVNGTVSAATAYYPLFWKITTSSTIPTLTTSDSHNSINFSVGQSAVSSATATDYIWLATPNTTSHTFKYVFLGSDIEAVPDVSGSITISGQAYKIWGFTNFGQATTIIVNS